MTYQSKFKKELEKSSEMDVKKREESEKISFKKLKPLEMGENDVFGRKKMFWLYELFEINTRRTDDGQTVGWTNQQTY